MHRLLRRSGFRVPDPQVIMARALGPAPQLRGLEPGERDQILSGAGTVPGRPGGSYDPNPDTRGYRARGLWPSMGTLASLPLRDPIVATALQRRKLWASTRDYRIMAPAEPTYLERVLSEYVTEQIDELPGGGLPGLIERIWTRDDFGFALLELDLDVEGLEYRLADLLWIHPCTVAEWVIDQASGGKWVGILQRSEAGSVGIHRAKLAHFGRGDLGRNPEGVALTRAVIYWVEAKAEAWRDYTETARRLGRGFISAQIKGAGYGSKEWSDAESMLDDFEEGEDRRLLYNDAMTIAPQYLGSVLPDIARVSEAYDYQISRGMDEQAQQLGAQDRGSRALGTLMDQAARRSLAGECGAVCRQIEEQLFRRLRDLHPRFSGCRPPRLVVRGLVDHEDIATANSLWQALQTQRVPAEHEAAVIEHALRLTGAI